MIQLKDKSLEIDVGIALKDLQKSLCNGRLAQVQNTTSGYRVSCPSHSGGKEKHPSCYVNNIGVWHCFTCGQKGMFDKFVGLCFESTTSFGESWLLDRYSVETTYNPKNLPTIELSTNHSIIAPLKENIDYMPKFHPYMTKRKLSSEICEKFSIRYDPKSQCIVFPVWDIKGNLVMLTRRSVVNKTFHIPPDTVKPVYLLNYIQKENIKEVVVCESQINALYSWTLGHPAIALFGTGSASQYKILNSSGIRHYILCFDGDSAGDSGAKRFINNIRKDVIIDRLNIPLGKDLNDLSKEEVEKLFSQLNNIDF